MAVTFRFHGSWHQGLIKCSDLAKPNIINLLLLLIVVVVVAAAAV